MKRTTTLLPVAVAAAGFEVVMNLAWPSDPSTLPDEDLIVEGLGMEYVALPVRWGAPTLADLCAFFDAYEARSDRRVFLHCIANKRVSTFLYLHRILRQNWPEPAARREMHRIWEPQGPWKELVTAALAPEPVAE